MFINIYFTDDDTYVPVTITKKSNINITIYLTVLHFFMCSPWSAVKKLTVDCNIDLKDEKCSSILDTKEKDDRMQISIWRDRDIRMQENVICKN